MINIYILIVKQMKLVIVFSLLITLFSCGGGGEDPDPEPIANDPTSATLVFPNSNSECTEGTNPSETESTIEFVWNDAMYADSYNLQVKNLNTGNSSSYISSKTTYSVKLKKGTPYSWTVISRSNKSSKRASSETWKFYNAGGGEASFAPFPAELVSPTLGSYIDGGEISLDWTGSDIDNDIDSYDVYFGENSVPELFQTAVEESVLNNISVESGKKYYWKVATKDELGNISISDVFFFTVN